MNVSFDTVELRNACGSRATGEELFGPKLADRVFALLADIEAAEVLEEVMTLYDVDIDEHDSILIRFAPESSATFRPATAKSPRRADGSIEWGQMRRLKLMNIVRPQP